MNDLIPNLDKLAQLLEKDSDAAQLVAAFSAASLPEAQANLRKIASGWDGPDERENSTGKARS
ncbi:hypothetical protein [Mycolicibacterium komossense]|uniref:Uncharacterized protein n=1 Tax=Mycolicibacterium komossense TaxID=1779 RepID=A0ABT3CAY8_9MYCO|nr:hypothetical protein [Mycolicibacterium komossense]MCV7226643.1 hypothetical protein [Mycolicibacterium komossense]